MDNRKKNFVYMTEFFFFFIWKMLYCGEMTGGKSMNKKGCNLKKILIGVSVGVMILASVVGVYLYVNRFDASKYVQAVLDVSYKNKTTLYQEVADVSEKEAKAVFEKSMKNTGGSIVNFSSAAAIRGFIGSMASPHYGASKAAIISLTQQLACEWGKYGVRMNAVVPGGVMTEAMKKLEFDLSALENIPLQRLSVPQDIANVVYFLASDKSSMITGQSIVVDGGANCIGQ